MWASGQFPVSAAATTARRATAQRALGRPESPVHPGPGRTRGPAPKVAHEQFDAYGLFDDRPGALDSPQALGTGERIAQLEEDLAEIPRVQRRGAGLAGAPVLRRAPQRREALWDPHPQGPRFPRSAAAAACQTSS